MAKRTFASRTFASNTFANATWAGAASGPAVEPDHAGRSWIAEDRRAELSASDPSLPHLAAKSQRAELAANDPSLPHFAPPPGTK